MDEHVLFAYELDGKGAGIPLSGDNISKLIKDEKLAWVHMDGNHPGTKEWITKEISYLDPFIKEALLTEDTRPRMTQINDGALIVLRGVNLNENADPEDMVSIRLWVDNHRIISVRNQRLKAVIDIEKKIKSGKGPKDAGDAICMLVVGLFKLMEPVLTTLDKTTDDIEEKVMEEADAALREEIVNVRKQAIMFKRYMSPQRDAIDKLRMSDIDWLNDKHKRYLQESYNNVTRYIEDLDAIRERSLIVKDELSNLLSDRLNKNMYVLSVIAAVFLPLGFLTGLLGINVGGIPGTNDESAFWIFSSLLGALVIIQIFLFKKLKWF